MFRQLLEKSGFSLPPLSAGLLLGLALIDGHTPGPNPVTSSPGKRRLLRIALTETAHLIWKLRCAWVVGDGAEPGKRPGTTRVANEWHAAINKRLHLDQQLIKRKADKKAPSKELVEDTWGDTIANEEELGDMWTWTKGVLVGRLEPRRGSDGG